MTYPVGTLLMYQPSDKQRRVQVRVDGRAKDGTLYITRVDGARFNPTTTNRTSTARITPAEYWRLETIK